MAEVSRTGRLWVTVSLCNAWKCQQYTAERESERESEREGGGVIREEMKHWRRLTDTGKAQRVGRGPAE